jgi:ribonuclease R
MTRHKKQKVKTNRKPKRKFSSRKSKSPSRNLTSVVGKMQKTKRGFGFVIPEKEGEEDIFVSERNMNGVMNGDIVEVGVYPDSRRTQKREGLVNKIIKRNTTEIVGTFERNKHFGFVVSDERKNKEEIFIHKKYFNGARRGDKVLVSITRYPDNREGAEGKVSEIISRSGESGGDIRSLIRGSGVTIAFPTRVLTEAERINDTVDKSELKGRRDLRDKKIFTIDGAESKDFDDAVSIEKLTNGNYLLGVHIADVSHYVKEDSQLDKEGLKRGNSIYLPNMVIPMLPEKLSNGICSLNENVDRLTLSVDIEIDENGVIVKNEIYESVIKSCHRLIYDDVSDILENKDKFQMKRYKDILAEFILMDELARLLNKNRKERGSIDFDLDEAVIKLDENGIPVDIAIAGRRTANKLIEEFMLLANETVAKEYFNKKLPFVYRVHEKPNAEKMSEFKQFISGFGIKLKGNVSGIKPKELNEILNKIHGSPEEKVISTVMLRAMQKAGYNTECLGHFGLALKYYCHFTSPIRRYPDLIIHRIIKESLNGEMSSRRKKTLQEKTQFAARHSSETEKLAVELEREVEKMKKAQYMSYHVGEEFDAVISGVTSFGLFAELDNTVEGLIRMDDLIDDYYEYIPEKYELKGRRHGRSYVLGDKIRVKVKSVDVENQEIDFNII